MVKKIQLQNGMIALVDKEDFEKANQYIWTVNASVGQTSHTVRSRKLNVLLQRFILGSKVTESDAITFKNKNDLDFRKANLFITDMKGVSIRTKGSKNGSSKYKGVSWCKREQKWLSQIQVRGKGIHLGYFILEDDAAKAYNEGAKLHFGESAFQNIIGSYNGTNTVQLQTAKKHRRIEGTTSKYRGVSINKEGDAFIAQTKFRGKYFYLGTFCNEIEAAKVYDAKSFELRGEKAILNFPKDYQLNEVGVRERAL